jgi:hypothetical protein
LHIAVSFADAGNAGNYTDPIAMHNQGFFQRKRVVFSTALTIRHKYEDFR